MKKRIISLILVFLMVFSLSIPVAAAQGTTQSGTCTDSQTLLLSNVDNFCEEFDIQQELPAMYSDEDVYLLGTTDYSTEDYFNKPRWVVTYEIHKYLVDQGIPLPDGESLAEDRVRGMEVCPEYFGEFPVPVETPWGPILQYDKLWNGIYWLETAEAGWALALAFPFFEDVRENTAALAVSAPSASEGGENSDFAYHFYPYEQSCLPLFELLTYAEETWAKQINTAALKNAILKCFPDYAREDAEEYANLPIGEQILFTPGAGTDFYKFPVTPIPMM